VIVLNTGLRAIRTLLLVCLFSSAALGQSVLNFPARDVTRIEITNTTPYLADVKFTLYNIIDGSPASGLWNPVSRRVPPKGQLSIIPSEIFRMTEGARPDTWIQASSSVSGLEGFYISGDPRSPGSGGEASVAQTIQTIPFLAPDSRTTTTLLVTNPAAQTTNVSVTFYSAGGVLIGTNSFLLAGHAQAALPALQRATSARTFSDVGVVATAVSQSGESRVLVGGHGPRAQAQAFVAPYFKNSDNTTSQLVLVNSTGLDAEATVTFFTDEGSQRGAAARVSLRPNGSSLIPGEGDGWLLVESTVPIGGMIIVNSGNSRTTLPLQTAPDDKILFSRFHGDDLLNSTLSLVGTRERDAAVTITLSRPDGTTLARVDKQMSPLSRFSAKITELVPLPEGPLEGYLTIQSTAPIFGLELINGNQGATVAAVGPREISAGFQAFPFAGAPRILSIEPLPPVGPDGVKRISIAGQNFDSTATLTIGGRVVAMTPGPSGRFIADLPDLEPGYVNVKVRTGSLESPAYALPVVPNDVPFVQRSGVAMYQKVEVVEAGLDPTRIVLSPIRGARVEVFDPVVSQVVSVSETDEQGEFLVGVPADRPGLTIRIVSRLRSSDVRVLDNMTGNRLYSLSKDLGNPRDTDPIELIENTRASGAFNILDNIQRGNALVAMSDPQFTTPPLTIYWSERNNESVLARLTGGAIRSTFFRLADNTAFILGDRSTDSDEFDDSVILHEYAHLLAARFSRDESPGGPHMIGDILDPRLAWSEGWANFFSSAVRGTSIYLDSKGPGTPAVRYDLEEDSPANDRPGYWSEASVDSLLWDLLDENQDNVDTAQFPFSSIWIVFTDLRNLRYVYLPYFLEAFLARNQGFSDSLRAMVIRRNIDFQPEVRPSVVNPFPRPIAVGDTRAGDVDSFTSKRTNLALSSHFWSFSTPTGGVATITLNIDSLGPANNPNANDLDLFLYDGNGKRIELSDRALNGQPEMISGVRLNPGTYYIEVRSFYVRAETNTMVFNSGRYRLSLQLR